MGDERVHKATRPMAEPRGGGAAPPRRPRRRWRWLAALLLMLLIAAIPTAAAYLLAVRKPVAAILAAGSPEAPDAAAPRGEALRLILDEAFWKARVELSGRGVPCLAVDLVDSLAILEIRGVAVRRCKLAGIERGALVGRRLQRREFRERLARPFGILGEVATLPKEPIRIEIAPKDTLEAQQAGPRKLEPEEPDLHYVLRIDGGLTLDLRQLETPAPAALKAEQDQRRQARKDEAWAAFTALVQRELPPHETVITLRLPRDDIKALYRALVPEAGLALRL